MNTFGLNALKLAATSAPNANVCVSPASLQLALDMTYRGANGPTQSAMGQALGIGAIPADMLDSQTSSLIQSLNPQGSDATVSVADSLWLDNRSRELPSFKALCESVYGAEVANLDLSSPESIDRINDWVSSKTNGKIQNILNRNADRGADSFLVNALYFKAPWSAPFNKRLTEPRPFHPGAGKTDVDVPMMNRRAEMPYGEYDGSQVAELPFGRDARFAFVVALPKSDDGLPALIDSLSSQGISPMISSLKPQFGELALPKFTTRYDGDMIPLLKKMGMGIAFGSTADFSKMVQVPPSMHIGMVKHDTYLKVDEDGAEAAAATSVGMRKGAVARPPTPVFTMIVDHPFFCAIVDQQTGAVLFAGAVCNPS
jgi:serpin B